MFDIVEYYKADPNLGEGVYTTVILSYYIGQLSTEINVLKRDFDTSFVQLYIWTYDFIEFFLWPDTLVTYVGDVCAIIAEDIRKLVKLKSWNDLLLPSS